MSNLDALVREIEPQLIADRRDFHCHAESGWCEFRTASLIARRLVELGYEVQAGRAVVRDQDRLGVPAPDVLQARWQRAVDEGGDPEFLECVQEGFTGVVGVLLNGAGPTVGIRFDIDALDLGESQDAGRHRPAREGFASIHPEASHACGHDAHAAVGLGVAQVLLRLRDRWCGTVKLVFQPAEEGVRGAKAMVGASVVDDVEMMLAHHLYSGWKLGEVAGSKDGYLATTKFDATFTGAPAHAAGAPEKGKNALLAAATAVLNLYAIPRHQDGVTRINVGRLEAGSGRNVIPAHADLTVETRGATTEVNDYMHAYALRVLEAAAQMHACTLSIRPMGAAQGANSTPELARRVEQIALDLGGFTLRKTEGGGGSEDYTYMMRRVQERGGQATFVAVGADLADGNSNLGHHTAEFDIDERALAQAVKLLAAVAMDCLTAQP
ncbi:MAG: amidohydrolase [Anaerolineae bacterium]|nr:amidohydrolase [Anaerolineae bacterium]